MIYEHACAVVTATVAPALRLMARMLDLSETDGMFVVGYRTTSTGPATHFVNNGKMPVDFIRALKSPAFLHTQAQAAFARANVAFPFSLAQVTGALVGCSVSDGTRIILVNGVSTTVNENPHDYLFRLGLYPMSVVI